MGNKGKPGLINLSHSGGNAGIPAAGIRINEDGLCSVSQSAACFHSQEDGEDVYSSSLIPIVGSSFPSGSGSDGIWDVRLGNPRMDPEPSWDVLRCSFSGNKLVLLRCSGQPDPLTSDP